jgi:ribonucleoside-diphosphate reductase alpha chain
VEPRQRLKEIHRQLLGIGGDRQSGFGPNRVRSLPDGVAQALGEYLETSAEPVEGTNGNGGFAHGKSARSSQSELHGTEHAAASEPAAMPGPVGELCPECGNASLVNEEGCRKCYGCGFSEC